MKLKTTKNSLDCSDDEHEFESMRIPAQEDEEEGPEVSETECDRELKTISKSRAKLLISSFNISMFGYGVRVFMSEKSCHLSGKKPVADTVTILLHIRSFSL
ncbi:hypothetical protein TNIN_489411 [Trichonephila inaurata madagascariensis]|uniref:Uncharacterized protein n=1 Tax=Trichonephila inaurata madagascariensis TaxID=2747483 RepID=A0A8X6YBS4_9ARAC|nr:hypothetical protein TNIN_489411 [Trichonephila inaurata madagascariensis]